MRVNLPFAEITVHAADGWLQAVRGDEHFAFELGAEAPRWAAAIAKPKSVLEKLGVTAGARVTLVGTKTAFDAAFRRDLAARAEVVAAMQQDLDIILVARERAADLGLARLRANLRQDGAIWVVRPKGRPEISEAGVRAAGKAAGLVDVKVVAFSDERSAEKFVIPLARRKR